MSLSAARTDTSAAPPAGHLELPLTDHPHFSSGACRLQRRAVGLGGFRLLTHMMQANASRHDGEHFADREQAARNPLPSLVLLPDLVASLALPGLVGATVKKKRHVHRSGGSSSLKCRFKL